LRQGMDPTNLARWLLVIILICRTGSGLYETPSGKHAWTLAPGQRRHRPCRPQGSGESERETLPATSILGIRAGGNQCITRSGPGAMDAVDSQGGRVQEHQQDHGGASRLSSPLLPGEPSRPGDFQGNRRVRRSPPGGTFRGGMLSGYRIGPQGPACGRWHPRTHLAPIGPRGDSSFLLGMG